MIFCTFPNEKEKCAKMVQSNWFDSFVHHYNIVILNLFDSELKLINFKSIIINKFKELLSKLKKFKVQLILILEYKKRNDCKFFQ